MVPAVIMAAWQRGDRKFLSLEISNKLIQVLGIGVMDQKRHVAHYPISVDPTITLTVTVYFYFLVLGTVTALVLAAVTSLLTAAMVAMVMTALALFILMMFMHDRRSFL